MIAPYAYVYSGYAKNSVTVNKSLVLIDLDHAE